MKRTDVMAFPRCVKGHDVRSFHPGQVAAFLEQGGLLGVGAPEKQPFALEK